MPSAMLVAPGQEPVALADLKAILRVESGDEDAFLSSLILAARAHVEGLSRLLLISQTWRVYLDHWPARRAMPPFARVIDLPVAPVRRIVAVRVFDADGNADEIAQDQYRLDSGRAPPRLIVEGIGRQPGRRSNGIEIDVEAGYGGPGDVPAPLRQAILRLAALWFENRHDGDIAALAPTPPTVEALIAPYRVLI